MFRASQIYGQERSPAFSSGAKGSGKAWGDSGQGWGNSWGKGDWNDQHSSWQEPQWEEPWSSEARPSADWSASPAPRPWQPVAKGASQPASSPHAGKGTKAPQTGSTTKEEIAAVLESRRSAGPPKGKGSASKGSWSGSAQRTDGPQTTLNTITLHGPGLQALGEEAIAEACQKVAIEGGFSVQELVSIPMFNVAHVEFSHSTAAADFLQATAGVLRIGEKTFKVKHPRSPNPEVSSQAETLKAQFFTAKARHEAQQVETEKQTDTLVVRGLGDVTEAQLREAFELVAPRLKTVKVLKDHAGQTKGIGWVTFHEIHEASIALHRFRKEGCFVAGKKLMVDFSEPHTIEAKLELEARKKKLLEQQEESHEQALAGPNADMWANYLAMFNTGGSAIKEEPNAKRMKAEEPGWLGLG